MNVAGFLLGEALVVAAGAGLLHLTFQRWRRAFLEVGIAGIAGLSILGGYAILGMATTLLGVLGASTRPTGALLGFMLLPPVAALGQRLVRRASATEDRAEKTQRLDELIASQAPAIAAIAGGVAAIRVGLQGLVISNDEYMMWALRGRAIGLAGRLDPRVFAAGTYAQLDYPLMVPSAIAWADVWGRDPLAGGAAHAQVGIILLGGLLTIAGLVQRVAGTLAATLAVGAVMAVPGVLGLYGVLLLADVPLMSFALAALLLFVIWRVTQEWRYLSLASLMAAAAMSTKAEGLVFVIAIFVGMATTLRRVSHAVLLSAALASAVVLTLPWRLYVSSHGLSNKFVNAHTLSLDHVWGVRHQLAPVVSQVFRANSALVPWPLLAVGLAILVLGCIAGPRNVALPMLMCALVAWSLNAFQYLILETKTPDFSEQSYRLREHVLSSIDRISLFPMSVLLIGAIACLACWSKAERSLVVPRTSFLR